MSLYPMLTVRERGTVSDSMGGYKPLTVYNYPFTHCHCTDINLIARQVNNSSEHSLCSICNALASVMAGEAPWPDPLAEHVAVWPEAAAAAAATAAGLEKRAGLGAWSMPAAAAAAAKAC